MKRLFYRTAAVGLALSLMAPLAMAQPAPNNDKKHNHPAPPPPATTTQQTATVKHDNNTVVQHDNNTVVQHDNGTVVQHPAPPQPQGWLGTLHTPSGQSPFSGYNHPPVQNGYDHPPVVNGYDHPPGLGLPPFGEHAHQWHPGDRYTGSREVVTNWSDYRVRRPPSGYEYVRDGDQLVLIAIASGVIADVLANAAYQ